MARKSAKQVGALWRHESESVGQFLTGTLDLGGLGEVPIAVFTNDRKEAGSKQPDFRIVLSEKPMVAGPPESRSDSRTGENDPPYQQERSDDDRAPRTPARAGKRSKELPS